MLRISSYERVVLAFVAAASCARPTFGQPAGIAGVVVDERTDRPLAGVLVLVKDTSAFAESDTEGRFRLDVAAGRYSLTASLVGYALVEQDVDVREGAPLQLTIRLPEGAGPYIEQVTVTGRAGAGRDAPAGAVLYGRELQTVRGLMFDDPLRAVQALPSASATDDFYSEFSVRGSTFQHIGFAIDGMPARFLMHTVQTVTDAGSTVMFNSDALGEVALLPGSYPQRLGRHLGAHLDLTAREGSRDDTRFRVGLSGTSATFLAEGPVGTARGSWLAAARRSYLDYLVKRLDGEAFAFGFGDAQTKIAYDITPRHQLEWLAVAGRSHFEEPPENLGANDVARAMSESWLSGLTWRYARSPRLVATQRIYATGVDFRNSSAAGGALDTGRAAELGWRADASIAASARWMFELGGDATRVSGRHERRRRFEGAASESVVSQYDAHSRAASAYALVRFVPASAFSITPGARIDLWALTGTVASSPWVNTEIAVGPRTQIRAGAGIYRQFPELDKVFGIRGGGSALRDEQALHVDAGATHALGHDTSVQLSWFTRDESRVLWTPGAESRRLADGSVQVGRGDAPWTNALDGRARGIEIVLRRSAPAGLSGWAGYAYGQLRYADATSDERFPADADQRHTITAFANYRLSNRTNLSGKIRYGSNYPIVGYVGEQERAPGAPALFGGNVPLFYSLVEERNTLRLPSYCRVDVRADRTFNWSARRITLFAEVINLLNRTNVRNVPYGIDRSGRVFGPTDSMMPILPSAGLVVEF